MVLVAALRPVFYARSQRARQFDCPFTGNPRRTRRNDEQSTFRIQGSGQATQKSPTTVGRQPTAVGRYLLIDIATAPATKHALRPQTARPRSLPRGPKRSSANRGSFQSRGADYWPPCAQPSVLSPHADSSSTVTGSCCQSLDASSAMPSSLCSELRQGRCVARTDGYRPCPVFASTATCTALASQHQPRAITISNMKLAQAAQTPRRCLNFARQRHAPVYGGRRSGKCEGEGKQHSTPFLHAFATVWFLRACADRSGADGLGLPANRSKRSRGLAKSRHRTATPVG